MIRRTLEGERVRLEPLGEQHVSEAYVSWFNDPVVCRYNRHGSGMTIEKVRQYVEEVAESNHIAAFAVIAKDRGLHVGNIALQKIEGGRAEYAVIIGNKDYWGKGIASEASRLLLRWGFEELGLTEVYCATPVQNADMRALAARLGFVERGIRAGAMQKGDEVWDVVDYDMRTEDLRA